jgi:putative Mn2+ efflux pump MntP
MEALIQIIVPVAVCVLLPVAIVFIVYRAAINADNRRAEILIKAIEANAGIDADKLAESLQRPRKSAREVLYQRLLCGCVFSFLGVASLIYGAYMSTLPNTRIYATAYLLAAAFLAIGLGYLVVYFVSRRHVEK